MIRGPVLPQARERLWSLVANRLDAVETGLQLVLESLDCAGGQLGPVDGLCRDAGGAPVLVILAVDGDALLLPRVVAAAQFLDRTGEALGAAVPEGSFRAGAMPRLFVIGTESSSAALQALARLDLPVLETCRLEPFRIAGSERFAVCRLRSASRGEGMASQPAPVATAAASVEQDAGFEDASGHWRAVVRLCRRLDPGVQIDGDRFRRRITWNGHRLGFVTSVDGGLRATAADGVEFELLTKGDVRHFVDGIMRRYADLARLRFSPIAAAVAAAGESAEDGTARAVPPCGAARPVSTLRSALAEALLSPEEFAALAEPADVARPEPPPD